MSFRRIELADIPELFAVRVATRENAHTLEELHSLGITEESVAGMLESGSHSGWVAEAEGRIVGFAMSNLQTGEMWVIAMLPEYEGRGLGGGLLAHAENDLFAAGWREIWLTTDWDTTLRAHGFYQRFGWRDAGDRHGDRLMVKRRG